MSEWTHLQYLPLFRSGQLEGLYDKPAALVLLDVRPNLPCHCWVSIAVNVVILFTRRREGEECYGKEGVREGGGMERGRGSLERGEFSDSNSLGSVCASGVFPSKNLSNSTLMSYFRMAIYKCLSEHLN